MTDFDNLVTRAQQGSKSAMNAVIKYMYKSIQSKYRLAWKELPGSHSLEDMVQYAMIGVLNAIKKYNGEGGSLNWLWRNAQSEINSQVRYLNYDKRKSNLVSSSLDKPLESDDEITLGDVLPCGANTEQEAIGNVIISKLIELLRNELSDLEFIVMDYMIREYSTKDIIAATGYKSKTVDNTKERIKGKVRKYLVVA